VKELKTNLAWLTWIKEHYPTKESAKYKCAEATLEMQAVFPDLTRHKGHVIDVLGRRHPHWWLMSGSIIVDPTVQQFHEPVDYEEYIGEEPHGKCYVCGGLLFRSLGDGTWKHKICEDKSCG
jgi:hypothetical protein